ncbi:hypothetical protein A0H81_02360 [Grifola frondosa]|uniref:Uncharacterized protein n=1 Tax=Grifola frondosa TaxID=5627 RepID=A0A1C7MMQ6_GRIFR|nr:hypothetical protein A0H81_02360 [Grifola frondosa]
MSSRQRSGVGRDEVIVFMRPREPVQGFTECNPMTAGNQREMLTNHENSTGTCVPSPIKNDVSVIEQPLCWPTPFKSSQLVERVLQPLEAFSPWTAIVSHPNISGDGSPLQPGAGAPSYHALINDVGVIHHGVLSLSNVPVLGSQTTANWFAFGQSMD